MKHTICEICAFCNLCFISRYLWKQTTTGEYVGISHTNNPVLLVKGQIVLKRVFFLSFLNTSRNFMNDVICCQKYGILRRSGLCPVARGLSVMLRVEENRVG